MITLDPGALAPHRPVEGRTPTGGGFVDVLAALTGVTGEQRGGAATGMTENGAELTGDAETDAELAGAVVEELADAADAGSGVVLADLADHPGLQRRQLLALLATAAASGVSAATGPEGNAAEGEVVPGGTTSVAEAGAMVPADVEDGSGVEADAVPSPSSAPAAADTETTGGGTHPVVVQPATGSRTPANGTTGVESGSLEVTDVEVGEAAATIVTGDDAGEAADADAPPVERPSDRVPVTRAPSSEVVDGGEPTLEPSREAAPTSPARTVAGRSSTAAAYVERLVEAATRLENLPPPRQLTLELGEVRVRMALEDGALRVQVLGAGDAPVDPELQQDVERELRSRGFDLGTDAGGKQDGADGEERSDPTWGPPHRVRRGPARSVPTATSDQHL